MKAAQYVQSQLFSKAMAGCADVDKLASSCVSMQERIRQKKEYDIVVNERDILGTQVRAAGA
jgi:uncharacterized protein involved in tolerance to divalent cations